ncbi:ligase-associated DNA damage response exonuclease [Caldilinea sp.]|uniref:ligase-associated DNA damage response exonuclease n=1 Tax=Caldilinea sp. TaxID=2293560 RepID=UPI002BCDA13B|nr:ligase-associated DNA damage response exonuclease [Caldilinea sp.]HRA68002.1 ligase-associated DNA damage response exonuclease [Caldilinea sp.]
MTDDLLQLTPSGLYCAAGDFYIDPWQPVDHAVITHAHADHARPGSQRYLTTPTGAQVLAPRIDEGASIRTLPYGERLSLQDVTLSLHPAGHLLGSAQVRVERGGEVWVVSGDYKAEQDQTCEPFEPVRCHTFITESTFGLPIYRWQPQAEVFAEINDWWRANQGAGRTSVLYAYALGKAQRLLAGVDSTIGPILVHGAVLPFVQRYRDAGINQPDVLYANAEHARTHRGRALVIAPPSAGGMTGWLRKFGPSSQAFASGWMTIRGARRRRAVDRGFVLSDHADWPGLLAAIRATGAERIGVTHGYTSQMVHYLRENGWQAEVIPTRFEGEPGAESDDLEQADPADNISTEAD